MILALLLSGAIAATSPPADPGAAFPEIEVLALQATPGTEPAEAVGQVLPSGLPDRPPPPRTMRDQWPMFAVFTLFWIGLMGYVLTFNGRIRRVADRLRAAEGPSTGGGA